VQYCLANKLPADAVRLALASLYLQQSGINFSSKWFWEENLASYYRLQEKIDLVLQSLSQSKKPSLDSYLQENISALVAEQNLYLTVDCFYPNKALALALAFVEKDFPLDESAQRFTWLLGVAELLVVFLPSTSDRIQNYLKKMRLL
jgi:hypothetical protein